MRFRGAHRRRGTSDATQENALAAFASGLPDPGNPLRMVSTAVYTHRRLINVLSN
jgi:hypothetical protein